MKIVILGSGNVATILGKALVDAGYDIVQVWSRKFENAKILAGYLDSDATDDLTQIRPDADLYLISVTDDAISSISNHLGSVKGVIAHTSGSTSIDVFSGKCNHYGVFYPFQTFSKDKPVSFKEIPVLIEAIDQTALSTLKEVAHSVSDTVKEYNSAQRTQLHIAGVFASNFTNHLYSIAERLLTESQMDFDLLRPLILETATKVQRLLPEAAQTGPAIRNDRNTMAVHQKQLANQPDLLAIYKLLSDHIITPLPRK